ncbi:hypothetical protein V1512DRAFT_84115 [Lipomyces arxii]|uniref:uncharacterized protein n=1 Tax=Lipomyces arxii TaxID=56418 RepID=UPI0034CD7791
MNGPLASAKDIEMTDIAAVDTDVQMIDIATADNSSLKKPRLILPCILSAVDNRAIQLETQVLIDSGATDNVIGSTLVRQHGIPLKKKSKPVVARVIDGRELELITHEAILTVVVAGHASEEIFDVTKLGHQQVVLGQSFLKNHNPEVDWAKGKVTGWNVRG